MASSPKLQTRHSVLARVLSVALFCSVFLQLATVTNLLFQEEQQHLPISAAVDSGATVSDSHKKRQQKQPVDTRMKKDYDKAAPKVVKDSGRCHYLPSISHRQTPRHLVTNLTAFMDARTTWYEEGLRNAIRRHATSTESKGSHLTK